MFQPEPRIAHVSDTALWSAVFRARESELPDALFRDPLARRLAGARGEQIAAALPFYESAQWPWIVRTSLFDDFIQQRLDAGTDMVVNLACGLDARPYRMELPSSLTWVEVDFPQLIAYKSALLEGEASSCVVERVGLDLSDVAARQALFDRLASRCRRALILSEGLLLYLKAEQVLELASDLYVRAPFAHWLVDIVSPTLLKCMRRGSEHQFHPSADSMKFGPANGPEFFKPSGWKAESVRSFRREAGRLGRVTSVMTPWETIDELPGLFESWQGAVLLCR